MNFREGKQRQKFQNKQNKKNYSDNAIYTCENQMPSIFTLSRDCEKFYTMWSHFEMHLIYLKCAGFSKILLLGKVVRKADGNQSIKNICIYMSAIKNA